MPEAKPFAYNQNGTARNGVPWVLSNGTEPDGLRLQVYEGLGVVVLVRTVRPPLQFAGCTRAIH